MLAGCGGGGGDGSDPFNFRSEARDRYVRVDRTGEPAIATALLSRVVDNPTPVDGTGRPINPGAANRFNNFNDQRDALNRGDPVNDARDFAFMFTQGPQVNTLANYHYELGPQLRSLGLTPCSTETVSPPSGIAQVDISMCVAQVAPVVLPDVITFDANTPTSWPNGRGYDDPVVDRLLAAALLKISGRAHRTTSTRWSASSIRRRTKPAPRCRRRFRTCGRRTRSPDRAQTGACAQPAHAFRCPPGSAQG